MGLVNMSLEGKVALVIGGAKNLGRVESLALAEAGADVAIIDIDVPAARETAAAIRKARRRALVLKADVRSSAQIDRAVQKVADKLGGIDIMVYNVGNIVRKKFWETTDGDWRRVIDVSLTGAFTSARPVARQMIKQGRGGKIINIGSIAAFVGEPERSAYCAAKGGLNLLTKTMAVDLAPYNVYVNYLCPGPFDSGLVKESIKLQPGLHASLLERILFHRRGHPEEIAGATVFLASPASDFMNGQHLILDGGMMAH